MTRTQYIATTAAELMAAKAAAEGSADPERTASQAVALAVQLADALEQEDAAPWSTQGAA